MHNRTKCILFTCIWFCFSAVNCSFAQQGTDVIELTVGAGEVIRNHPDFPEIESPASVGSFIFSRHLNGFKPWHRYYNFPVTGFNLTGGSIGNRDVLGYFAGVMVQMSFEKKITEKWSWGPRLCLGGAWFSHPFNERKNPENVVIGTTVSFLTSADVALSYQLNPEFSVVGKLTLLHSSNSHFKLPNVGMNLPVITLGARYNFSNSKVIPTEHIQLPEFKKIRFNLRLALGMNESGSSTTPVNGPKYPIYLASLTVSKMYSPVNKVSAGVEAWYNKGVYDFIVSQEFYDNDRHKKSTAAAIVLGHEFLMGRWGLVTTGGIYFYNPFYKDRLRQNETEGLKDHLKSIIPARLGVQYHLKNTNYSVNKNIFLGIYIKSNFGQADFLETGLGIIL